MPSTTPPTRDPQPPLSLRPAAECVRCKPTCAERRSVIIYDDHGPARAAGLRDRQLVLQTLTELAVSLCAWLVVPPPCELLNRRHNEGRNLPCTHNWTRYMSLSLSAASVGKTDPEQVLQQLPWLPPHIAAARNGSESVRHIVEHTPGMHVARDTYDTQYQSALDSTRAGQAFVWDLQHNFFAWNDRFTAAAASGALPSPCWGLPKRLGGACEFTHMGPSTSAVSLRDSFYAHTRLMPADAIVLHVRRRDRITHCNSSVTRVRELAAAGLESLLRNRYGSTPVATALPEAQLVIFTDETAAVYLDALFTGLRADGWRVHAGDREMLAAAKAREDVEDNYLLFEASMQVLAVAAVGLHLCNDCPWAAARECFGGAAIRE